MTFAARSSPAPMLVKPQPAPAILSQELVHTMLLITHDTRKQPSTGPRTTHSPHRSPTCLLGRYDLQWLPCLVALLPVDDLVGPTYSASLRPHRLPGRFRPTQPRVDLQTVRLAPANSPPPPHGWSAPSCAGRISPLLL
jgi:hypothetical protein